MFRFNDEYYMQIALDLAQKAFELGEIPVGAVIVTEDNEIVAAEYNSRESDKNALAHAELKAIDTACKKLGGWRLFKCRMYVTLEPCPMCTGAIINARIPKIIFGAKNIKGGSCGSIVNLFDLPYNHRAQVTSGVLEDECAELLKQFGHKLRLRPKKDKTVFYKK